MSLLCIYIMDDICLLLTAFKSSWTNQTSSSQTLESFKGFNLLNKHFIHFKPARKCVEDIRDGLIAFTLNMCSCFQANIEITSNKGNGNLLEFMVCLDNSPGRNSLFSPEIRPTNQGPICQMYTHSQNTFSLSLFSLTHSH